MTQFNKLLHKFYASPERLRYAQIEKLLIASGCIKIPAKGSHVKFKHPHIKTDLIIPVHNNDCKEFYKKSALKYIKQINV